MKCKTDSTRMITTNTGKIYIRKMTAVMGAQGYQLKEQRLYVPDAPAPIMTPVDKYLATKLLLERAEKYERDAARRRAKEHFGAMAGWSYDSRQCFKDWFVRADFTKITDTGEDSVMGTLMYPDWVEESDWDYRPWQTFKKHVDSLNDHGVRAWGDDWATVTHTEFAVEFAQRPHFHIWMAIRPGRSKYNPKSKFASLKLGLNGRVFYRWLEAVWGYITGQSADLIAPRLTWVPRTAEERWRYAQDLNTPIKVMRYWVKEGQSEEMAEKRLQLRPPTAWIARRQRFTWVMPFGIDLKYVEVPVNEEQELMVRGIGSAEPDANQETLVTEGGEVLIVGRFSPDAKMGARQYGTVTPEKHEQLLAAIQVVGGGTEEL